MAFAVVSVPLVVLPALPLWFVAGATTVTSVPGCARSAWTSASIPGAPTPSSFVTSRRSGATGVDVVVVAALEGGGELELELAFGEELLQAATVSTGTISNGAGTAGARRTR